MDFNGFDELKESNIHQIIPIENSRLLWVVTSRGLFELDTIQGIVAHYFANGKGRYKIPFDNIRHIYRSKEGKIWMATSTGLIDWNYAEGTWKTYSQKNGLPNDNLYAVYEDPYGYTEKLIK